MSAKLVAGADAIQSEVEDSLAAKGLTYKKLSIDEKLAAFQSIALTRMAASCGVSFDALKPFITDFLSFGASIYEHHHTMDVVKRASMAGISSIELHSVDLGGASVPAALEHARWLCEAEERIVLIAGSEIPRGGPTGIQYYREASDALLHPTTELHAHTNLVALYALLADRLMFEESITREDVEQITAHYRSLAIGNERAANFEKPLKPGDLKRLLAGAYATPMVAVATDHGAAFLVANDRALERLQESLGFIPSVNLVVQGGATATNPKYVTERLNFSSPAKPAAERAFARAGLSSQDIDYAWVYDCFTLMLVRQAADYFKLSPRLVAHTLKEGFVELATQKRIPVNQKGGILNTQAAISLSAASGLLDVIEFAQKHPEANHFLFGGNGGLDTVNSVAILSRTERERSSFVTAQGVAIVDVLPVENLERVTLYALISVRFNPGEAVPETLGAFKRQDGTLVLAGLRDTSGERIQELSTFTRDKSVFTLFVSDAGIFAAPV